MSEQNNNNIEEEEEIEENNNEQVQEEYDGENGNQGLEEEEGQEFAVAFDIQINDISYILLIGKTEESKLILRLVDKEDDNKPFFQNEFSLDELKEINNYFLHFTNENDAIDSIIKNLNENDKEIEILDENNIKLTVQINEEGGATVDFILPKLSYEIEGEEEQNDQMKNVDNGMNIQNEGEGEEEIENIEEINKEGIEEVENENENEADNYIDNAEHEEANLEYSEENNEKNGQVVSPVQEQNIENNDMQEENDNRNQNVRYDNNQENNLGIIIEDKNESDIIQNQKIINEKENENLNSKEIKEENKEEEKGKEEVKPGEETKISRVIEELKNNLDSLGGAMNYIEQDEEEQGQNANENEINAEQIKGDDFKLFKNEIVKMINDLSNNFNKELKKQNDYFISQQKIIKDENDKKIQDLVKQLNTKDKEVNNINNNFKKILNETINNLQNETKKEINKINDELNKIKNQENISNRRYDRANNDTYKRNNEFEKITNSINLKIKDIEQRINNMKIEINKNNKNTENINIKSLNDKIANLENKLKKSEENLTNNTKLINERKINTDNKMNLLESKISLLETSIRERKNLSEKVSSLESKSKFLENKINNLEKNKKDENDNKDIIERINNVENLINEMESEKNESEAYFQKTIDEINNNDIINKINNLTKLTTKQENEIKNLNESLYSLLQSNQKLTTQIQSLSKKPKDQGDFYQKVSISSDEQRKPSSSNAKKNQNQIKTKKVISKNNMREKNYRINRQLNEDEDIIPPTKKYVSQTYNRSEQFTSHSVNRLNIRPNNSIDANIEYQINTRPRSPNKEIQRKTGQQNLKKYKIQNYSYSNINTNFNKNENGISDSGIIQEDDFAFVENRLRDIYPNHDIDFNLVYRASEDGDKAADFHRTCDKIGPNVTLIKTRNGYVFGGFTVKNWEHLKRDININKPNLGSASRDPKAFGFSINYQKIYENVRKNEFAIWCNRNYGPTFKNNFFQILDKALEKGGYCSARNNSHFGGQNSDFEINGGEAKFAIYDIEVFELIFQ